MTNARSLKPFHCWRCGALIQAMGSAKVEDGWECWRCGAYIAPDRTVFLPASDQIRLYEEFKAEIGL